MNEQLRRDPADLPAPNSACAALRNEIVRLAEQAQQLVEDLQWLLMQCKNGIALSRALHLRLSDSLDPVKCAAPMSWPVLLSDSRRRIT